MWQQVYAPQLYTVILIEQLIIQGQEWVYSKKNEECARPEEKTQGLLHMQVMMTYIIIGYVYKERMKGKSMGN